MILNLKYLIKLNLTKKKTEKQQQMIASKFKNKKNKKK